MSSLDLKPLDIIAVAGAGAILVHTIDNVWLGLLACFIAGVLYSNLVVAPRARRGR